MTKPQPTRKINRNVFDSKLYLRGLTLETLGKQLNPPICKSAVSHILRKASPDYRMQEIAKALETNVSTIFPKTIKPESSNVLQK